MANTQTMQSLVIKKTLLYIGVSSLILVMIWIVFSTALSIKKTTIPSNLQEKTKTIAPSLDITTIDMVKQRRFFTKEELSSFPISKEIKDKNGDVIKSSPTPSATPIPTLSPETTSSPLNQATISGEVIL